MAEKKITADGRKRVVVENIQPVIDGGSYPAKAVQFAPLTISADVFTDGHDEIGVQLLIRHASEKQWVQHDMAFAGNDCWTYTFEPGFIGLYEFRVRAWIDHFRSWQKGLFKKWEAGMDVKTELRDGIALVQQRSMQISGSGRKLLERWIQDMEQAGSSGQMLRLLRDPALSIAMAGQGPASMLSSDGKTYLIAADRPRALFSTWYELFPRSAGPEGVHGTFKDVIALLPSIVHMGFDVLYLPPIHPIGEEKRKGRNNALVAAAGDPGSPWAIGSETGGHKSLHPQLGTMKEFRQLVKAAEKAGIEIAMDIALQCAPDHPYVKEHPEWFRWRSDGTVQYAENPPKKYEDILPFDFETAAWASLWEELKSIFLFWIDRGVKIFRVDNPHTKSFYFWEWAIREIKRQHPDVLFLAEAFTRPRLMERLAKLGFSQSYTYFTWRNTKQELETYMKELCRPPLVHYFRPNFWPNTPDILPPFLSEGKENAHLIRLILAATLSSSYGIYGPVFELGVCEPVNGKEEYADNEKYEIRHWPRDSYTRIREILVRINRIRRQHPALQQYADIRFLPTGHEQVIAYYKCSPDSNDIIIVVVNLDPFNTHSTEVSLPQAIGGRKRHYSVRDLLSGDRYEWFTGPNYVSLNPYDLPAHVLHLQ